MGNLPLLLRALLAVVVLTTTLPVCGASARLLRGESNSTAFGASSFGSRLNHSTNSTQVRKLSGCGSGNPIDDCWQCDPNWSSNRQKLADCAFGYGVNAVGGRNGAIYVVTDAGNDNPTNPVPGTLRYAVIQTDPLWIIFSGDMTIALDEELIMTSYKTVDGRGAKVQIVGPACFVVEYVSHVIIHGVHIRGCKTTGPATVRSSVNQVGNRGLADGDGVHIRTATNVWVDHNYLSSCYDGLVDVTHGCDGITISNNYFENHDKVMLLGAHDTDYEDKNLHVTVAYNHFGQGLVQRMPRCRFGTFHVLNNYYENWQLYAIGGSSNPTINSEGNYFQAGSRKEVTKQMDPVGGNWRSAGDLFLNGAWFDACGASFASSVYQMGDCSPHSASQVPSLVANAGPMT